ncbi:MAG: AmmeMemoRadiSam system protein B [Candidatus Humimicrobiaceae bacterium]
MDSNTRSPIAAGSFYPGDKESLNEQIEEYLGNAKKLSIENIKALIAPHAGYIYSGQVAAHAYNQLAGSKYDTVFVIAPSHSEFFDFISIYPGSYATPLGVLQIDSEKAERLKNGSEIIRFSSSGHNNEHSLEVQLPFIQYMLGDVPIVPITIGNQNYRNSKLLGETISTLFGNENILIVASTDLSHYHPYDAAVSLDKKAVQLIKDYNTETLAEEFSGKNLEMCGGGPVIAAMTAAKAMGANKSKVLEYKNSGDVVGDMSAVVGYLSAVLYK